MSLFKVKATPVTRLGITAYPIVPEHFNTITSYLNSLPKHNLTYWMSIPMLIYGGNHFFKEIDGYLYLYHLYKNNPNLACVPFNKHGEYLSVQNTIKYMEQHNMLKILAVPETSDWLNDDIQIVEKKFNIHNGADGYEYVYDNQEMYEMQGGKWREFRYKVNKFIRYHGEPEIITYTQSKHNEYESLYNRWSELYQSNHKFPIWDIHFYQDMLKYYPDTSYLFKINGEPVGFLIFTPFVSDTCFQAIRKLLFDKYSYLFQYMMWKQAGLLLEKGIRYLDDGDDGRRPSLTESKRRMRPISRFNILTLWRK